MFGFLGGSDGKEFACNNPGSILGLGKSSGGGNGNLLQYSCLENPMDRGAWWATVHSVAKSWTWLKQLSTHTTYTLFGESWTALKITMGARGLSLEGCVSAIHALK